MKIDDELNKLKNIRQAEAPPFLYTRIRERISRPEVTAASLSWRIVFVTAVVIILSLNIGVLINAAEAQKTPGVEGVVNALQLSSSNDLYHE